MQTAHCAVNRITEFWFSGSLRSLSRHLWRMPEMVAPRALVFQPLVKGSEALGTRLPIYGNMLGWSNSCSMLRPTMLRYVVMKCCDRLARAWKCLANNVAICWVDMLRSFGRGLIAPFTSTFLANIAFLHWRKAVLPARLKLVYLLALASRENKFSFKEIFDGHQDDLLFAKEHNHQQHHIIILVAILRGISVQPVSPVCRIFCRQGTRDWKGFKTSTLSTTSNERQRCCSILKDFSFLKQFWQCTKTPNQRNFKHILHGSILFLIIPYLGLISIYHFNSFGFLILTLFSLLR